MNDFDRMINNLNMLNETELQALSDVCLARVEGKKKARREALRQKLMTNLQTVLSDILHNDFSLIIKNTDLNPDEDKYAAVCFEPEEGYSIHIR